jgi:hypothetical protein
MQTINKVTAALTAIRGYIYCGGPTDSAMLDLIYVIVNETLNEVAPEIETIKIEAMAH